MKVKVSPAGLLLLQIVIKAKESGCTIDSITKSADKLAGGNSVASDKKIRKHLSFLFADALVKPKSGTRTEAFVVTNRGLSIFEAYKKIFK